tara:strand:+ start:840 stop:986 length:147 start_codon:yes stop_codon:yes gene_type:complete
MKANKEVKGTDAMIPAVTVDLLAISEIRTTIKAVKIIFKNTYIKLFNN